ncbi:immunity 52 family protein [Janthinobacterium sp. SUN176]|uniref:immunity 52 family protein n=1 Tax=Janthinobacterium sp. SUN176 TaxID=3014788 RepID=UPI002712B552|nr:immunity 52 family protein [Janthinobacterium sp. SUN176]MDO8070003.1 immunity 52 family protein [Janthinobacterium sp. SUN176]
MTIIKAAFKKLTPGTSLAFRSNVEQIGPIVRFLQKTDPLGKQWFLMGDTEEESLRYPAFDALGELTPAAEAVLETEFKGDNIRYFAAWNGELKQGDGATITFQFHDGDWPAWSLEINYQGEGIQRLGGLDGVIELLSMIAGSLQPSIINVARYQYFEKQVFQDRPGVGWMLYLPRVLAVQQVPEARALVPVMITDEKDNDKQIGTIIVSVTDVPFSDENPEHVKIANAIEIRLVDQDLLPPFADH